MDPFMHAEFWAAVGQTILSDLLHGGDNAVVIALACRKLPVRPAARPGVPPEVLAGVRHGAGMAGALLVLFVGQWVSRRRAAPQT